MKCAVSVVIPVKNEQRHIKALIKNLDFALEVLFVDNGSSDSTVKLARESGARVVSCKDRDFARLRVYGEENASCDWILAIDADMRLTRKLREEVCKAVESGPYNAYRIGRRNVIFGRKIDHTDWSPRDDCHVRLYRRGAGSWTGRVHETWQGQGGVGLMKASFIHSNYSNVEEYLVKMDKYSQLAASKTKKPKKLVLTMLLWAAKDFLKRYVYKLGFLDGYHGLMLSYLQGVYYLCLGVKVYENKS